MDDKKFYEEQLEIAKKQQESLIEQESLIKIEKEQENPLESPLQEYQKYSSFTQ